MIRKQLLILSGKGGTGKTTVASALIALSGSRAFADCDVDAPNLHLTMQLRNPRTTPYYGLGKAEMDPSLCTRCGACEEACAFGAIHHGIIDAYACEGCGVCERICPADAIAMRDEPSGDLMLYQNESYVFSTAILHMGSGASGKLVTAVKRQLLEEAPDTALAIIDGSPGIGCPVIASISGADLVLMVTEPSLSGIHDLRRILDTIGQFGIRCAVCINRCDVNPDRTEEIRDFCDFAGIPIVGEIPYDRTVVLAVNRCRSVIDFPNSPAAAAIQTMWKSLQSYL